MNTRRLKADELLVFQARYGRVTGYPPPLEYLLRARVYGFYHGGELVGGFSANSTPPWRYFNAMPAAARPPFEGDMAGRVVVEIACTWLALEVRKTPLSWGLWWYVLQAVRTGEAVLFGSDVPQLADSYRAVLNPARVYEGELEFDGEQTSGWVFLAAWPTVAAFLAAARQKRAQRRRPS